MKKVVLLSIIFVLFISSQTHATLIPGTTINDYLPIISGDTLTDPVTGFTYRFGSIDEFEVEATKYKLKGSLELITDTGIFKVEELEFDPDPFITGNILITNNTGVPQVYTVGVALPTVFAAPNFMRGSVVVSLLDAQADGATFSTVAGSPIYTAQIDFGTVATMLDDPYSLSGTNYVNSGLNEFGWQVNGVAVTSSIGIQLKFQLSPGDSASILSRFEVAEIPEPATLLLLGLGAMTLLRKRHS